MSWYPRQFADFGDPVLRDALPLRNGLRSDAESLGNAPVPAERLLHFVEDFCVRHASLKAYLSGLRKHVFRGK